MTTETATIPPFSHSGITSVNPPAGGMTPDDIWTRLTAESEKIDHARHVLGYRGRSSLYNFVYNRTACRYKRFVVAQALRRSYSEVWGNQDFIHPFDGFFVHYGYLWFKGNPFNPPEGNGPVSPMGPYDINTRIWGARLTQKAIAERLGVSRPFITKAILGQTKSIPVRMAIASAAHCHYYDMWGLRDLLPEVYETYFVHWHALQAKQARKLERARQRRREKKAALKQTLSHKKRGGRG